MYPVLQVDLFFEVRLLSYQISSEISSTVCIKSFTNSVIIIIKFTLAIVKFHISTKQNS